MNIDRDLLIELTHDDVEPDGPWAIIQNKLVDTWRWGEEKEIILRHKPTDTLWGYTYRVETSHDEYRNLISEEDSEVELWKAVAVPVHTTEYREAR
jgi:hypothetical protein